MNTIWSTQIQTIGTLYLTRQLRFDDRFKDGYIRAFNIGPGGSILEIGAGPGAMTMALKRWYPHMEVVGSDRDAIFLAFARAEAPGIDFVEADITALPFEDNSFDVIISNTVQEHIEPGLFFGEQLRVLRPGGVCLVLSARRGINIASGAISEMSDFESELYKRTDQYHAMTNEQHRVGKYGCTEQALACEMQRHGFRHVQTHYLTINLTPDSDQYDAEFAIKIIEANRRVHLDTLSHLPHIAPGVVSDAEMERCTHEINRKYDRRIAQYLAGDKQWDTNVALTMVLRGVKG